MQASKLLPEYVAELQLECPPLIVPLNVTVAEEQRRRFVGFFFFFCHDAISNVLTSEFVSDADWRLTVVGLLVLVRALRLQRAAVVVAVHLLVLVGEFSICRRDTTQVTLPVETASCLTLSLDFNICLPNPAERRVCLVCARFIFFAEDISLTVKNLLKQKKSLLCHFQIPETHFPLLLKFLTFIKHIFFLPALCLSGLAK